MAEGCRLPVTGEGPLSGMIPPITVFFSERRRGARGFSLVYFFAAENEKSRLNVFKPAFRSLAPHRGHISNFLPGAVSRGQGGFREHREIIDILNLFTQSAKADAQNFGLGGNTRLKAVAYGSSFSTCSVPRVDFTPYMKLEYTVKLGGWLEL